MPIALLDIFLLAVMLISGFLALVRGFMREILSIMAWGCAAAAAALGSPKVLPFVKTQINNDYIALGATIAGLFLGTLIIVSVITVRISDKVLDSRIGALDRTLGFIFGLARGLLIVVIAFIFFDWLVPAKSQPSWVVNAKSRVILKGTGDSIQALLPEDMDKYLSSILKKKPKGDEDGDGGAPPPEQRSSAPSGTTLGQSDQQGYDRSDRSSMRQLIDGRSR